LRATNTRGEPVSPVEEAEVDEEPWEPWEPILEPEGA